MSNITVHLTADPSTSSFSSIMCNNTSDMAVRIKHIMRDHLISPFSKFDYIRYNSMMITRSHCFCNISFNLQMVNLAKAEYSLKIKTAYTIIHRKAI